MKEYKLFERDAKKLWYEKNFRDWLRKNRKLPYTILNLIEDIKQKEESASAEGVEITCIDINEEDNTLYSKSFQISVGDQSFFLKVENESIVEEGGFQEMESTLLAKEELDSLKVQGVRIVEPLWGYEDQKEHKSYFVAEWLNLPILDNILSQFEDKQPEKAKELLERVNSMQKILKGYREVSPANMFYDQEKDEIVLFDLHL